MSTMRMMNFSIGILVLAGGALPFLSKIGVIGEIPSIPGIVFPILVLLGGLMLLIDGFATDMGMGPKLIPKGLNRAIGFIVLIGGVLFLLGEMGSLAFMAGVPGIVVSGILALAGFVLFLDAILGVKDF